jgi:diadenosine tetraphosphate (Ap4A) HIT family hydrolase
VHEGTHWLIEHAYPVGLLGWMVIVLRRHAAALHELSPAEFSELGQLQAALIPLLRELRGAEREYVACFAEAEGFRHVHFHVVPVRADFPAHLRGARSLMLLTVEEADAVSAEEIREFCSALRTRLETSEGLR